MSRPTIKADLLAASRTSYEEMMALCHQLAHPEAPFSFVITDKMTEVHWQRDKNVRDVLIHLYEWHQLVLTWIRANQAGQVQPFFPAPYNWRTYGKLNQTFIAQHQATTLASAEALLANSHQEMMTLVGALSNEALFTKQYFAWTGTTALGSYFVSSLSSHYDWASKKIKRQLKADKSK